MKYKLFTKKSLFLALAALVLTLSSCIKEDLDECYKLTLVVHNVKGDDITAQKMVTQATLFVFDETGKFLEKRDLDSVFILGRKAIELNYPENQKLHCVAWGNLQGGQQVSNPTKAEDLTVSLIVKNDRAQIPDSLYFGSKDVTVIGNGVAGGNQEIVVLPKTGTLEMVTVGLDNEIAWNEGLRASSNVATCNFYMDRTKSTFDNQGNLTGDSVAYNPDGTWKSGEWNTPNPLNFVEGQRMTGTLTVNGRTYSVKKALNDDGVEQDIDVSIAHNTLVQFLFDEKGQLSARIKVTPWGVVEDDPDLKPNN